jgi:hypothetical protein
VNDHRVDTGALFRGFDCARRSFSTSEPGTEESFRAIFEALAWLGAIRDRLRSDRLEVPAIIDGLYYMRNVVLHQGADVLYWLLTPHAYGTGAFGAQTFGGVRPFKDSRWPQVGTFEKPESRTGEVQYEALLAGASVATTLEEAMTGLRDVWARSGYSEEEAEG